MKEKQNDNIIFLNLLYKNAAMGIISIDIVLKKIENEKLAKLISEQKEEYESYCEMVQKVLIKFGAKEEEISKLKELSTKMMSEAMTMGKSDNEIAKMMMQGNERGALEVQEKINLYEKENIDEEVLELARKLIATEEHNREELKQFL
ncbi:MAG: hypothetical protein E7163_02695 [Firmicutes bacterium]|nr:hypothetical protein [Bacillota bacterium]